MKMTLNEDNILNQRISCLLLPDIVLLLPDPIVKGGLIAVSDSPGLGVEFIVEEAKLYLAEEDKNFFD